VVTLRQSLVITKTPSMQLLIPPTPTFDPVDLTNLGFLLPENVADTAEQFDTLTAHAFSNPNTPLLRMTLLLMEKENDVIPLEILMETKASTRLGSE
jgi:hypothetical protein